MATPTHTMLRVLDEQRAKRFYREAFGFEEVDRVDCDDFSLIFLRVPESAFELELTTNRGQTEPDDLVGGYGHLALIVTDISAEHARLEAAGLAPEPLESLKRGAFAARFFFLTDPDGYRIEVLERSGRFA
jgi:lactoylglutathione lyase